MLYEYSNILDSIDVISMNYKYKDINANIQINGNYETVDFIDFLSHIEYELNNVIEILVDFSLKNINNIPYFILGGKALNNIIKPKYLQKSFDYDIHSDTTDNVDLLKKRLVENINQELNLPYRKYSRLTIFLGLKKLGLVDDTLKNYYLSDNLIFRGYRHGNFRIGGLFIKLKLSKIISGHSVFIKDTNNYNFTNYKGDNILHADNINTICNKMKNNNDIHDYNILYLPFADIDSDNTVNFGVSIYRDTLNPNDSIYKYRNINYAGYIYLLFNLISYITISGKSIKNYNKLKNIITYPGKFRCSFYNKNTIRAIITDYLNLNSGVNKLTHPSTKNTFSNNAQKRNIEEYIKKYPIKLKINSEIKQDFYELPINTIDDDEYAKRIIKILFNFLGYKIGAPDYCSSNVLGPGAISPDHLKFLNDIDNNNAIELLHKIIFRIDNLNYILHYTGNLYLSLNTYSIYKFSNIDARSADEYNFNSRPFIIPSFIGGNDLNKQVDSITIHGRDFDNVINEITRVYTTYHTDPIMIDTKARFLNEEFNVYSFQKIFSFKGDKFEKLDIFNLKSGDVIILQQYLSTTYIIDTNLDIFFEKSNIVFNIKINKSSSNWLYLGKYSFAGSENEILLNRGSILIFEKITYELVKSGGNMVDIAMLHFKLENDVANLNNDSKFISNNVNYYDQLFQTQSYITILKYLFNNYINIPYEDANKIEQIPGTNITDIKWKFEFNIDTIYKNNTKSTFRPNHGIVHAIRVSIFVYIYLLYIKKFGYIHPDNNTNRWDNIIDPKFILKTIICSLFLVSGRKSEQAYYKLHDFEKYYQLIPGSYHTKDIAYYSDAYNNYVINSSNYFIESINRTDTKLFTPDDINKFANCIKYNHYYGSDPPGIAHENRPNDEKLICFVLKNAHNLDLIRVRNIEYNFDMPINKLLNKDIFNTEMNNLFLFAIEMCKLTGDNIVMEHYKEATDIDAAGVIIQHDLNGNTKIKEPKFIDYNNNPIECLNLLLEPMQQYTTPILDDIKDKEYHFIPIDHQLDPIQQPIQQHIRGTNNQLDSIQYYIRDKEDKKDKKIKKIEKNRDNKFIGGNFIDNIDEEEEPDINKIETYYKNKIFGNTIYTPINNNLIKIENYNITDLMLFFYDSKIKNNEDAYLHNYLAYLKYKPEYAEIIKLDTSYITNKIPDLININQTNGSIITDKIPHLINVSQQNEELIGGYKNKYNKYKAKYLALKSLLKIK